ncbi:MAG TPA: DUF5602 domain-containing protein [Gemmatimonadales bacterium]|jgi:hypothetical protein
MTRNQKSAAATRVAAGVLAVATAIITIACSGDSATDQAPVTQYGTTVTVGNGIARSYLVLRNGTPIELGVALSQGALDGLPTAPQMGGYEYLLPLPAGNTTQYQVVGLNWNPTGHPPPMVYTVPHFDFHFYMQSLADRNAIDLSDPSFATKAANLPTADFRLAGYVADPPANAIPHMGLHWTDSNAPEFHGQAFTRTFITGSWNGQFTFFEPMVTRAYLLTDPNDSVPVASATERAISGYYPTAYRVSWDQTTTEWRIGLAGLTK